VKVTYNEIAPARILRKVKATLDPEELRHDSSVEYVQCIESLATQREPPQGQRLTRGRCHAKTPVTLAVRCDIVLTVAPTAEGSTGAEL
jgi:hypothetical protein